MKIRILQPAFVRLNLQPGDEIHVSVMTPELDTLLRSERLDRERLAEVVGDDSDDETATVPARGETATTRRGRGAQRTEPIPG